jgi:ATP-binding cassette subfamily C protein CydC
MRDERPLLLAGIAALVLEAAAGFLLLAVSVWFISACALAGQAGLVTNFNYVAPATAIRLLAILRIGAGYGEKYLGHRLLLERLARRRHDLLASVFAHRHGPEHARATATLQQAAEDWAARISAVQAPQFAATLLFAGLLLFVALLLPAMAWPLLGLGASLLALRALLLHAADRMIETREARAATLDRALESWLGSSSLWSLRRDWADDTALQRTAGDYAASRRALDALLTRGEDLLLGAGLLTALLMLYAGRETPATPLATVPVLIAAALRDWLRPALLATVRDRDTRYRSAAMFAAYRPAPPDDGNGMATRAPTTDAGAHTLTLQDFRWQRDGQRGAPLCMQLSGPGLYLLSGSSGTGKSSLFEALTGELASTGSARLDGTELADLSAALRRRRLYLAEQFGHVLSDTLAHNLRIAAPDAPDRELTDALRWSGFAAADEIPALRQWLGEQGRPLSGGERKRLLLARARLSRAPVWLLDEPFEGLDDELAAHVAERLNEAARDHLVIVASHRRPASLRVRETLTCQGPDTAQQSRMDGAVRA